MRCFSYTFSPQNQSHDMIEYYFPISNIVNINLHKAVFSDSSRKIKDKKVHKNTAEIFE